MKKSTSEFELDSRTWLIAGVLILIIGQFGVYRGRHLRDQEVADLQMQVGYVTQAALAMHGKPEVNEVWVCSEQPTEAGQPYNFSTVPDAGGCVGPGKRVVRFTIEEVRKNGAVIGHRILSHY